MKTFTAITLAAVTVATSPLSASDVRTESVSAEAKWLLHLNLDAFRETSIGSHVFDSVIKPRADETPMGFRIKTEDIYEGIHAITAYGNTYQVDTDAIGVLLVRTEPNLKSIFEAALIQQEAAGGEAPDIRTIRTDPYTVYTLGNELFAAILPQDFVVISKSLDQLVIAVDVIEDRAPGLDESDSDFSGMARADGSFFFLATAEGFNQSNAIPPQARVLKMAEAARLVLGERSDDLFLNLALMAQNEKMRDQLAKIIQGLLALVSLTQIDNQDLAELALNTEVESRGREVSVAITYPVERVLQLVKSHTAAP
ncbi:MAG: hypothetical protein DRP71_04870 [Verrucomicrobia bacterium]|nr:MAG: hypothetical protein DRP71_04870 [Verrucomicrobiota bacterium]